MNSGKDTRRASKFDGEQRDGQREPTKSRPQQHFNSSVQTHKRLLKWLRIGR